MLNIFNKIFYKELCISKMSSLDSKYFLLFQCFHHILFLYLFNVNLWIVWVLFELMKIWMFRSSKIPCKGAGLGVLMAYCIAGLRSEPGSFRMYKWQVYNHQCSLCSF